MPENFWNKKTSVRLIEAVDAVGLARAINDCNKDLEVFATQIFQQEEQFKWVAFVYHKVKSNDD